MYSRIVNFQSFLIYFIPIALVTGPFLPDATAVMSSLIFIYLTIKKKEWQYYRHPLFIVFIFWCIYITIRSIFSDDPTLSLESSLFYFRFGFFSLSVWYIIDNNKNFLKTFASILTFTFIVVLIDGYIQYFTGYNILGFSVRYYREVGIGDLHRISGFFDDQLILGSYLSRLFPLVFSLIILIYTKSRIIVILSMVLLIATDVLVFISGERSAFFYLLLSTTVIIIFVQKWRLLRISTFVCSIIIMAIISVSNDAIKNRMIDLTLEQTNVLSILNSTEINTKEVDKADLLEKYLSGEMTLEEYGYLLDDVIFFSWHHQQHFESSIKMFKSNPIFGIGPKLFRIKCNEKEFYVKYGCSTHPHNIYIQLLSETGIIGFIPVIACLFFVCYIFFRQIFSNILGSKKSYINDYQVCLYTALLVTLWPLIPTGNVFNNWLGVIFFLPVGFLLNSIKK